MYQLTGVGFQMISLASRVAAAIALSFKRGIIQSYESELKSQNETKVANWSRPDHVTFDCTFAARKTRIVHSMSELQPIIPREENQHGKPTLPHPDTPEPVPITEQEVGEYREQDRFLPVSLFFSLASRNRVVYILQIANVSRIMKATVPPTAKIAKDAKECVQECVSEFISFITSEAAEKCQLEKRKTIGGEDILNAMRSLGFEDYAETLKVHLAKLRDVCGFFCFFFLDNIF